MYHALVIGGDSFIGRSLVVYLTSEGYIASPTSRHADKFSVQLDLLTDPATWVAMPNADVAYLCAAVARLEDCESDPQASRRVNVDGMIAAARKLHDAGMFVVFLSTNHVFDGLKPEMEPADPYTPRNEYGRQKAEAEQAILSMGNTAVLRLTKVIGPLDARLMAWRERLLAGEAVAAFDDLVITPVSLDNVLRALLDIGLAKKPGIYQISGPRDETYYTLALALANYLKVDKNLVRPDTSTKKIPPQFRPAHARFRQVLPKPIKVPGIDEIVAFSMDTIPY
jgi:dTDP-4-dehydrorhamnose reductase